MNLLIEEYTNNEHRNEIVRGVREIRVAQRAAPKRASFFRKSMRNVGRWMIVEGEALVKKFDTPNSECAQPSRSFAH